MINSRSVKAVLEQTLRPIKLANDFETPNLESSALISSLNGSMLSYASSSKQENNRDIELNSLNNLKMLSLLTKDKWFEDEHEQAITSTTSTILDPSASSSTPIENTTVQTQPKFCYHYNVNDDPSHPTRIYTYEIEDLHTCVAQIPQSDLLLLLIADSKFPYGLLALKMKAALRAFKDMFNYKLG